MIAWFKSVAVRKQVGFVQTPDGENFVVMRPEQLAELESIVSDEAFVDALSAGVTDAIGGAVSQVKAGEPLRLSKEGALLRNECVAQAVEDGVNDAMHGNVRKLRAGERLSDLRASQG
jgi:hypothetical protein